MTGGGGVLQNPENPFPGYGLAVNIPLRLGYLLQLLLVSVHCPASFQRVSCSDASEGKATEGEDGPEDGGDGDFSASDLTAVSVLDVGVSSTAMSIVVSDLSRASI